ncbi:RidA family protein [Jiangella gansuensis]|uniref:RidA family protein n=1 Tax=Jiangella gansuensis TaxID=281473 RepID=UPI00047889BE|nr:RidA family protein [Jiangella gansuensis]
MTIVTHINPETLHSSPAFTQVVRVSTTADLVYVGGQNGVDSAGVVVGPDLASQTRQALANLRTCLAAAGAGPEHVVKWTILIREGESLEEGFAAFGQEWGMRPDPPVITSAFVSGLAVPGALVEIEAVAAVPAVGAAD